MQIVNAPNQAQPEAAGIPFAAQSYATTANSPSGASSSSGTSTAAVTANDFLQLLVTELQNQDPTANTDPNEYVNQLVQVNALQQQIQMNQTLDGGPSLTGAGTGVLQQLEQIEGTLNGDLAGASANVRSTPAALTHAAAGQPIATGNLSAASDAKMRASAETVASALAPHSAQGPDETATGARNPANPNQVFQQFAARLKAGAARQ